MIDLKRNLIFDLGMHRGLDTAFYLAKGFDVVALEANPALANEAREKLADAIQAGRLRLLSSALWLEENRDIDFFINAAKDDWSSVQRWRAERGGHEAEPVKVSTATLSSLLDEYGTPYFIKCDIEGTDEIFADQLLKDPRRPSFVSIEAVSLDAFAILRAAGYDRFQLINQAFNGYITPPMPAREGKLVPMKFNGQMSGLFGRELEPDSWLLFDDAAERYMNFRRLKERDTRLAHGWLDIHATTAKTLGT